jgi:hypothetical protein
VLGFQGPRKPILAEDSPAWFCSRDSPVDFPGRDRAVAALLSSKSLPNVQESDPTRK